jgi:two-component system response regulator YesN
LEWIPFVGNSSLFFSFLYNQSEKQDFQTDYINKFRIEEAKYLLDRSSDSVTEIASQVGYSDSNYFSKVFRKWEHVTPHDYRKRKRGE